MDDMGVTIAKVLTLKKRCGAALPFGKRFIRFHIGTFLRKVQKFSTK
jgi:hypothetical protein